MYHFSSPAIPQYVLLYLVATKKTTNLPSNRGKLYLPQYSGAHNNCLFFSLPHTEPWPPPSSKPPFTASASVKLRSFYETATGTEEELPALMEQRRA